MTDAPGSVVAIVPARNEAPRIVATIETLRAVPAISEIVVVDDASIDGTGEAARAAGARVVTHMRPSGKGAALRSGVASVEADILVFIDGDLGGSASVAAPLLEPVMAGTADMAIAQPPPGPPSGFGAVEGLARLGVRSLTGRTFGRPLSGQRSLRRAVIDACGIADGFGVETALTIDALRAGFTVVEVPFEVRHRRTGRDWAGFVHRARQGMDVVKVLATRAGRGRP